MIKTFDELFRTIEILMGEKGCEWDRKQTLDDVKKYILEEAGEVAEAIDKKDNENLKEELGDLLYMIMFTTAIAEKEGLFDLKDVMHEVKEKMIRRHPHVFGGEDIKDPDKIIERWNEIKAQEMAEKRYKK